MYPMHELYLAVRPELANGGSDMGKPRDLRKQVASSDVRHYLQEASAWRWLDEYRDAWAAGVRRGDIDTAREYHPGYVLELHLDRLFQRDRTNPHDTERRYHFHEAQLQEHAVHAEQFRDGASRLLDVNDLAALRAAAESWLAQDGARSAAPSGATRLASVLRALIGAGKLGGGR